MSLVSYAVLISLAAFAVAEAIAFRVMKEDKKLPHQRVQPE